MSEEIKIKDLLEGLEEFTVHQPPPRLYRFYSRHAISALNEGKLKITPLGEFNDPFEVWAGLPENALTEEQVIRSVLAKDSLFHKALLSRFPDYDRDEDRHRKKLISLIKSDPKLWRFHLKSYVIAVCGSASENIGASCFAGFNEEELFGELGIHHWAMYGDSHQGFMLAYNGRHPLMMNWANAKWLFPVDYVEQRHTVDLEYFEDWNDRKMWRTFRHWTSLKAKQAWQHEKEWRLICPVSQQMLAREKNEQGKLNYFIKLWKPSDSTEEILPMSSIITSVSLGARASEELESLIMAAVEQPHLRHISVFKMVPDDTRYKLVAVCKRPGAA